MKFSISAELHIDIQSTCTKYFSNTPSPMFLGARKLLQKIFTQNSDQQEMFARKQNDTVNPRIPVTVGDY